ncbi:hypothetical protein RHGRI_003339 [Rhododendron griersonianum]|uniref:Aminotransferase-like plant mobile domain-containing protein n=1 Tax=Rhododendron griersonianum TaxID=479676 RepID=A0AAV6L7V8_9ERIC|nr:hypothetical protein RHGRI_003339 [Rhododendron griersonianum]
MAREIPQHIRTHFHLEVAQQWTLEDNDPRLKYIEKSSFGWVRKLESFKCNIDLLKLLYSRFMPETLHFCTVVLPNNTGAKVDTVYLTFLQNDEDFQDFEHIRKYSWGSAMLALLIDNLKKQPSKKGVVNFAGSAALLEFSRISNVVFQSDLSFLKNQLPLTLSVTAVFHGSIYAHYRPDCCFQQFDGVPACTSTPQLPFAFKVLKRKIRQRKGPQYHTDWNEEVPIELWANRHETIIGMLRYGDDGPENDEETPENEVEIPRMEESLNQPENEEERESEIIEVERNEEEREPQQVARLHKRARK